MSTHEHASRRRFKLLLLRARASSCLAHSSGFNPGERDELCRMAEALGGRYSPELSHRTTHLVCKSMMCAFGTPKFMRCEVRMGLHARARCHPACTCTC
jgi:hypothetical protein